MNHEKIFPWKEFIERYLINHEEFVFLYKEKEYHFAFADSKKGQMIAELNIGNKENGYKCYAYKSPIELLNSVKIDGRTIQEVWNEFE